MRNFLLAAALLVPQSPLSAAAVDWNADPMAGIEGALTRQPAPAVPVGAPAALAASKDAGAVVEVNDANFDAEISRASLPVLVDFNASWCVPCKKVKPILEELAREYKGRVKFCAMDVDRAPNKAKELRVKSLPTFAFYKRGGEVSPRVTGFRTKQQLVALINAALLK